MADNLSVNITADATQMRAQLALAQADLRAYATEVRKAAADVRQSGNAATAEQVQALEKASASYNAARAAVQQHATAMATQKTAVNAAAVAIKDATTATTNHGAATEAMVLVHEAMSGRFTKMGGSLMILTSRLAGNSMAMMALAGAFGVGAMAALHFTEALHKLHDAKLLVRIINDPPILVNRPDIASCTSTIASDAAPWLVVAWVASFTATVAALTAVFWVVIAVACCCTAARAAL